MAGDARSGELEKQSRKSGFPGKIVLGLIALLLGITFLFELKWNKETERLSFETCFRNAEGLNEGAPVIMSGIAAGFVAKVAVHPAGAQCPVEVVILLNVKRGTKIPSDSTVGLQRDRAMGDTEAVIHVGTNPGPSLADGGTLRSEE
jgi:ABC-type transporter Mla subunit MlaD